MSNTNKTVTNDDIKLINIINNDDNNDNNDIDDISLIKEQAINSTENIVEEKTKII